MTERHRDRSELFTTTVPLDGSISIPTAIVLAVCEVAGQDPHLAPPLGDVLDPSALDQLFETSDGRNASTTTVTFPYMGYGVVVDGSGSITVRTLDPTGR